MNVQYVGMPSEDGSNEPAVYVLEVNPRASRTVPFLSKITGVPMVKLATSIMLGKTLAEMGYPDGLWPASPLVAIKAPVFSMSKLVGVDTYLGPEMKSTGEVMGIDTAFEAALTKGLLSADLMVQPGCTLLVSIAERDKEEVKPLFIDLHRLGCRFYATEGTAALLRSLNIPVELEAKKIGFGHPDVVDVIRERKVTAVVNTVTGQRSPLRDGFEIRRSAAEMRMPCFTSLDTVRAAVRSLLLGTAGYSVQPLHNYVAGENPLPIS